MILVYLFAAVVLGHGYPIGFVLICIGISMRAYGFAVCGFCDLYVDGISVFVVGVYGFLRRAVRAFHRQLYKRAVFVIFVVGHILQIVGAVHAGNPAAVNSDELSAFVICELVRVHSVAGYRLNNGDFGDPLRRVVFIAVYVAVAAVGADLFYGAVAVIGIFVCRCNGGNALSVKNLE